MEYAESITQGESINSSLNKNNVSNVIETFKPHQEDYSPTKSPYNVEDNREIFKKTRSRRPLLVIQLESDYQSV